MVTPRLLVSPRCRAGLLQPILLAANVSRFQAVHWRRHCFTSLAPHPWLGAEPVSCGAKSRVRAEGMRGEGCSRSRRPCSSQRFHHSGAFRCSSRHLSGSVGLIMIARSLQHGQQALAPPPIQFEAPSTRSSDSSVPASCKWVQSARLRLHTGHLSLFRLETPLEIHQQHRLCCSSHVHIPCSSVQQHYIQSSLVCTS